MSLRWRLALALFLLSVVPLTVVTAYSYRNSKAALRQAAEQEGRLAAAEMGRRMEVATAELSKQLDRLWDMPREPLARAAANPDAGAAGQVAQALGDTAVMLDRLEFVPGAPPAPAAPSAGGPPPPASPAPPAPAPPAPPGVPAAGVPASQSTAEPPGPPTPTAGSVVAPPAQDDPIAALRAAVVAVEAERHKLSADQVQPSAADLEKLHRAQHVVIDIASTLEEAAKAGHAPPDALQRIPPAWHDAVNRSVASGLHLSAEAAAAGLRAGAREIARHAEQADGATAEQARDVRMWRGALGVPIRRQGRFVGTVNAKVNLDRMLGLVFGIARTDEREVPFALSEEGKLFAPASGAMETLQRLGVTQVKGEPGATSVENRDNWVVVSRRDPSGMTFGIARPLGESLEALRRSAIRNLLFGLLFAGLALVGIVPVSHRMTRDLSVLADGAREIARGNLSARVPVRSADEIGRLATAFNQMAEGVERHQKLVVQQERLQRELELCRRIQAEMLPHGALQLAFGEVKGVSIPAREVGGDFFNYFALDDGQIVVLVGDVSGKGVGAALLMANIQATLRARLPLERDLARLVDAVDRDVDERTPGGVYATLFVGIIDPRSRRLRYVNAGHHPQFLLRATGSFERMASAGLPVGLFAGHGYSEQALLLEHGDLLFFYTDGIIETENAAGDMFGLERLEALVTSSHGGDVSAVLERVETAVRAFRGDAEPFDDATLMALRVDTHAVVAPGVAAVPTV